MKYKISKWVVVASSVVIHIIAQLYELAMCLFVGVAYSFTIAWHFSMTMRGSTINAHGDHCDMTSDVESAQQSTNRLI